jgi:hypothetical protein
MPLPQQQNDQYYEVNPIRDIDILFMVDNSPSMKEEQDNLAKNFPVFIDALKNIPGGLPNVQIGVISSDLGAGSVALSSGGGCSKVGGDRGILQAKPGCGLNPGQLFIKSTNNGTATPGVNFTGDLSTVFSCMAALGTSGCGYEHQLQAARVALYAEGPQAITPQNAGFVRPGAFLALIFITDEDDCSAPLTSTLFTDDGLFPDTAPSFRCAQVSHVCNGVQPPVGVFSAPFSECTASDKGDMDGGRLVKIQEIVDSIKGVKLRPEQQILVSGIFGWSEDPASKYEYVKMGSEVDYAPICKSANGNATGALRMKKFVDAFGANGSFYSICQDDFRPAMKKIGDKLAAKLGNPCISAPLVDTKLDVDGIQAECLVADRPPVKDAADIPIAPCGSGKMPCWKITADAGCTESGYKIDVDRGGVMATPGTQQSIKCLTCTKADPNRCSK